MPVGGWEDVSVHVIVKCNRTGCTAYHVSTSWHPLSAREGADRAGWRRDGDDDVCPAHVRSAR